MRVATFQMLLTRSIEQNQEKIAHALASLSGEADVLITPECALTGYLPPPDFCQDAVARAVDLLRTACRTHKLALVLGTAWRERRRAYNRALLIDRTGRIRGAYDKVCLVGAGSNHGDAALFVPGSRLDVFTLHGVTVGLQICLDMRFAENWRILSQQGAQVVFQPTSAAGHDAWKRPVLAGTIATRAADNGLYVAVANNALAPQMMVSTINNPNGEVVAAAEPDRECVVLARLDLSRRRRWFAATLPASRRSDLWNRPVYRRLLLGSPRSSSPGK